MIVPATKTGLLALLASFEPIEDEFPPFDENLLPVRDVIL